MRVFVEFPVANNLENAWGPVVSGEIVEIAAHHPWTYVVHKNPWPYTNWDASWRVSAIESGMTLHDSFSGTRAEAIRKARERCSKVSYELVLKCERKFPAWTKKA